MVLAATPVFQAVDYQRDLGSARGKRQRADAEILDHKPVERSLTRRPILGWFETEDLSSLDF